MMNFARNGDFSVAQRAASFSSVLSGYTLDGWYVTDQTPGGANLVTRQSGFLGFPNSIRLQRPQGSSATGAIAVYQVIPSDLAIALANGSVTLSLVARKGADWSASALYASIVSGTGLDQGAAALGNWQGQNTIATETCLLSASPTNHSITGTLPADCTEIALYLYFWPTGTAGAADYCEISGVRFLPTGVSCPPALDPSVEFDRCTWFFEALNDPAGPCDVADVQVNTATAGKATLHFARKRHQNYAVRLSLIMSDYHLLSMTGMPIVPTAITDDDHKSLTSCRLAVTWNDPPHPMSAYSRLICDQSPTSRLWIDADL